MTSLGDKCVTCGHDKEEHLLITSMACSVDGCTCTMYKQALPFAIRTMLSDQGVSRVAIEYGSSKLQLTSDAAVQIGLELISAGYAARNEEALFKLAMSKDIDILELLKIERGGLDV